jgi:endonuclease/exonuclease/phosphatase family metal-dependent hydrolase
MLRLISPGLAFLVFLTANLIAKDFSLVTYNVENLFDLDGIANYDEYQPATYTPEHMAVKLENIARVLAKVDSGAGPDVVVFNEIEIDQSPMTTVGDLRGWLDSVKDKKLRDLAMQNPLPADIAGLPAEAWLLKACEEAGLRGYHVATTSDLPGTYQDGRPRSVRNVVFSRFPITSVITHPTPGARSILEVQLDVNGHPLTVFANHWKSGAGDPRNERVRLGNARTLRERLDQIFAKDPLADVFVAGDFNSHYNQNRRYPEYRESALIDVLGSQGNELALRKRSDLYNLWFELPTRARGSDIYRDEWGTLMHILASRGLYDTKGLQYRDNSFEVLKYPAMNTDVFGRPYRWSRGSRPGGFSDHFPILARFRVVEGSPRAKWMALKNPSTVVEGPAGTVRLISSVDLFKKAVKPGSEPADADFRDGTYDGKVFLVDGPASVNERGHVSVTLNGLEYSVFTHNRELREKIRAAARENEHLRFYGQLSTYRGRWQFVLHGLEWLQGKSSADARPGTKQKSRRA